MELLQSLIEILFSASTEKLILFNLLCLMFILCFALYIIFEMIKKIKVSKNEE
jgi:hypothetical protein